MFNILGKVLLVQKETVRSAFIALVFYQRYGIYEYILAPHNIKKGSFVISFQKELAKKNSRFWFKYAKYIFNLGNSFLLKDIKIGTLVYNVEKFPGNGGTVARAAGTSAKLVQKIAFGPFKIYVAIRLKSGMIFYLKGECVAVIGQCSNPTHRKKFLKKAGISRRFGIRPSVRGVAMNPIDHPHGGGEGKTSGGRSSVSAWGKLAKGKRTLVRYKRLKLKKIIKKMRFGRSLK